MAKNIIYKGFISALTALELTAHSLCAFIVLRTAIKATQQLTNNSKKIKKLR